MDVSATDKCLERLGTSLNALLRNPGMFLNRLHPGDRARYLAKLREVSAEADVQVILYDENNRPRRDKIALGMFVEFVDDETQQYRVGLVVGCLLSRLLAGPQPQDLLLVVELPGESGDTAKMPPPDSVCRVVPTSAVTCKIDVEQRAPAAAPKLLSEDMGFVVVVGSSFYGIDQDGTHAIGAYTANLISVARSRRGEMYATTEAGKLLSVELEKGRVKELATTRLADSSRKNIHESEFAANPIIKVRGLCFAEGRPAAFDPKLQPGAVQLYGIGKDIRSRGGDCLCTVSPSGKLDVVFELGRKDVVALAIVPIRLSASEPPNVWSRVGPSDADLKAMRFIIWTEKAGLFVVDETRRCLQQLGGELVRSLEISAIAFDSTGDMYAAGSESLYTVSPTGRVVEVAPLAHLPGRAVGLCAAPRVLVNPAFYEDEEPEEAQQQKSPSRLSRSFSWFRLSKGSNNNGELPQISNQPAWESPVSNLLRLLRLKSSKSPASTETKSTRPKTMNLESNPPPRLSRGGYGGGPAGPGGSFSNRRISNPLLPGEGTSMGEANNAGSRRPPSASFSSRRGIPTDDDFAVEDDYSGQVPVRVSNNDSFQSASSASPSRFRYANEPNVVVQQSRPSSNRSNGGPYFPVTDSLEDDIRLPRNAPLDIAPPPTAPPPTTARAGYGGPPPPVQVQQPARPQVSVVRPAGGGAGVKYTDVGSLLQSLGLGQYMQAFVDEDLTDMTLLCSMYQNERDFKEMLRGLGVSKLGHREMIAHAVKQHMEA